MFTKAKFEVSQNPIDNSNDIVELDMDMLNHIGGGDGGVTSMPYPGK